MQPSPPWVHPENNECMIPSSLDPRYFYRPWGEAKGVRKIMLEIVIFVVVVHDGFGYIPPQATHEMQ